MGAAEMPMATMAFVRLGPKNAANAMAKIRKGQAKNASVMREMMASTAPPTKPAKSPIGTPIKSEMLTEITPAIKDA